jgi:peptide/nickel transport system ATP-binding protein
MTTPLLKVENLRIALAGDGVTYDAVENVSFEIGRGEAFGLVGESGCGKSITALSVMGLLRWPAAGSSSTERRSRTSPPPRCAACAASASP